MAIKNYYQYTASTIIVFITPIAENTIKQKQYTRRIILVLGYLKNLSHLFVNL